MRSTQLARLAALALVLSVSACSDTTAPEVPPIDLSAALSETSFSAYVPAALGVVTTPDFATAPSACAYNGATQSFACPDMSANGVTVTRSFQLLNASGTPQPAFDPATISAIRTFTTLKGLVAIGTDAVTFDHNETMTLSGLRTGTHVLDGTQLSRFTGTFDGIPLDETVATTIAGLQLPDRNSTSRYPKAGTITVTTTEPAMAGQPASVSTMVITFNGTSKVSITFTYNGITERCTMDLAAGPSAGLSCS